MHTTPKDTVNSMANQIFGQDTNNSTTDDHNYMVVEDDGSINANIPACICLENSSSTPLGAGATFTGEAVLTNGFGIVYISVYSDQASATNGLVVEQSIDGTNWDFDDTYTIPADTGKTFSVQPAGRYIRVKYTNGGTEQTEFRLMTTMKQNGLDSSHRIQDDLLDDDDGRLRLSVLKLRTSKNSYVSGAATNSGNFKVSLEEFESGVSEDSNTSLRTAPLITDEYANVNRILGDNCFKGSIIAIPPEHHEIHCGDSYTAHHVADLGNGASIDYLITVPDWGDPVSGDDPFGNQGIKVAHFLGELSGESEADVFFYESPTITANGTALSVLNRNRNSSNVDLLAIYQGATVSATGTELEHTRFGSGRGVGGGVNRTDEWVLKNNTSYLVRVTNLVTTSNYHSIRFQYYVHGGV